MKQNCVGCGNEFVTKRRRIKYCSYQCWLKNVVEAGRQPIEHFNRQRGRWYVTFREPGQKKATRLPRAVYNWKKKFGDIPPRHEIHHINGIKTDDRIENLVLLELSEHKKAHSMMSGSTVFINGEEAKRCPSCGELFRDLITGGGKKRPYCMACHAKRIYEWRKKNKEKSAAINRRYQEKKKLSQASP